MNYVNSPYGQNGAPQTPPVSYDMPQAPRPAPRVPDRTDRILAFFIYAGAWVYARAMFNPGSPLGALFLTLFFYGVAFAFVKARRIAVPKSAWWLPATALLFSCSYLLQTFELVHFLAFQWAKASCLWFLAAVCGIVPAAPRGSILTDALKAAVLQPFSRFGAIFPAMFRSDTPGTGRKTAGWVILGLAAGIIPCAVVISLLSYDAGFNAWLEKLFSGDWVSRILLEVLYLAAAVPIAMYFFSAVASNHEGLHRDLWNERDTAERHARMAGVLVAFGLALMAPILIVYAAFFAVQWDQYLYAFLFRLPSAFESYSAYARDGFFELCAVACINAALMFAAQLFLKKKENGDTAVPVRVFQGIYAVATLGLLATALAKMLLYVRYYGLTPSRVYATWFMLAVAVVFLLVLVSLFARKLRLVPAVFAVGIAFFAVLCLVDSHTEIARYNVRAYETRQLHKLDVDAMYSLDESPVAPLLESLEKGSFDSNFALQEEVHRFLCIKAYDAAHEETGILQMTPFRIRTNALLAHYREAYPEKYAEFETAWESDDSWGDVGG